MYFKSPWQFSPGSQLAVALRCPGDDGEMTKVTADGLVVDCQEIAPHRFQVTVLFLDLSEDSHVAITDISHQLDAETEKRTGFTF
jgi:hypothetical protein